MIKKNIYLTLAVIATFGVTSVAIAETDLDVDLYGSFRGGFDNIDADTEDDGANGRDFLSRVGVKASTKIGEEITGFTQIEYGIRSENLVDFQQNSGPTLRVAQVGLKSKWGQLIFGSQTLLWHKYVRNSYFSDANDTIRQGTIRDDDLLQYYHSVGKLSFGLGLQLEGQDGDSIDQVQIGGQYEAGPVKLQAAYSSDQRGENTGGLYGLRAFWTINDQVLLSAYTHFAEDDYDLYTGSATGNIRLRDSSIEGRVNGVTSCVDEDRTSSGIYARFKINKNQIHARYAVDSCDISGDVESIKVEYVHFINKKYRTWVSFEDLNSDSGRAPTSSSGADMSALQLGVRADF